MAETTLERRTICFSGHVQGVGFRYNTVAVAQGFAVQGFVQNLPDRRVLLVAEGTKSELNKFVAALQARMETFIEDMKTDVSAPTGEFRRFEIRH